MPPIFSKCESCNGKGVYEVERSEGPSSWINCEKCGGDGKDGYDSIGGMYKTNFNKPTGKKGSGQIFQGRKR